MPLTLVELTPVDAEHFIQYQKHHDKIHGLLESGALNMKAGKVILNIHDGQIMTIVAEQCLYKNTMKTVV